MAEFLFGERSLTEFIVCFKGLIFFQKKYFFTQKMHKKLIIE